MVKPAAKQVAADGSTTVTASQTEVWVEADSRAAGIGRRAADPVQDLRRRRSSSAERLYGWLELARPWRSRSTGATTSPTCSTRRARATSRSTTWTWPAGTRRWSASRTGACWPSPGSTSSGGSSTATTRSTTRNQALDRPSRAAAHLPDLPLAVPHAERQALLHRQQRRLRLGQGRSQPRDLGPGATTRSRRCPACATPHADRDQRQRPAARRPRTSAT